MLLGWTLEQALREQVEKEDQNVQRLLAYVPIALHDFFHKVSESYVSEAVNYTTLVSRTISDDRDVAFITVNYDTILEKSLRRWTGKEIRTANDYIDNVGWSLFKLHGSVGWGWPWQQNAEYRHLQSAVAHYPLPTRDMETIEVSLTSDLTIDRTIYYPAIALPVPGKGDFICPPQHIAALRSFLSGCYSYLFIGFSANDSDVLKVINNSRTPDTLCFVGVVAMQKDIAGIADRLTQFAPHIGRFHGSEFYSEYGRGFTGFINKGQDDFLAKVGSLG